MTMREEQVMTHMVIFRHPEGKAGYHQAENVDEAVRFVERLRNQEHVTDARIFRMEEVPIEFRTYYKVELASAAEPSPAAAPAVLRKVLRSVPLRSLIMTSLLRAVVIEAAPGLPAEPPRHVIHPQHAGAC